ncbi:MAG TPA: hypothetical protein P5205_20765 [Candidatus Paceibacterota bacterium]|nr:hypothetical protein [Verrucomicrobiota bacterium]HSA12796.1 hypothetical protein [Candidatus Paceibacterota bacterium]
MNSELDSFFAAAKNKPAARSEDTEVRRREQADFPARFLAAAESTLKPVLDATAATLQRHGYGATVELVAQQAGSDPNSFPYVILHFSPQRCAPTDLGYIYTLAGASVSFICRRNDLCVEVVVAHPAGGGVERRVNFSSVPLANLTPERVSRLATDAIKQIVRL